MWPHPLPITLRFVSEIHSEHPVDSTFGFSKVEVEATQTGALPATPEVTEDPNTFCLGPAGRGSVAGRKLGQGQTSRAVPLASHIAFGKLLLFLSLDVPIYETGIIEVPSL